MLTNITNALNSTGLLHIVAVVGVIVLIALGIDQTVLIPLLAGLVGLGIGTTVSAGPTKTP